MALLALYPDEQERAYQEIKKAFPDNQTPVCFSFFGQRSPSDTEWIYIKTFDDLPKLSFVEAYVRYYFSILLLTPEPTSPSVIYEALRMFPPVRFTVDIPEGSTHLTLDVD